MYNACTLVVSIYLCNVYKVCDASDDANWRQQRLTTSELLMREWERGKKTCPLLSVFGIFNTLFKIDWLHCADQGVAADFLGNLFKHLVKHKMPGSTELIRCDALGVHMVNFYKTYNVLDKLKGFLPKSYESASKTKLPPKLKGSAAAVRALVPFGNLMAVEFLSEEHAVEAGIKSAAKHLLNCYEGLHLSNEASSHEALYQSSKSFALQYGALHAYGKTVAWKPKPKMHMFLELCAQGSEPQKFWNYRDEDFGGSVARQSKMKGSWKQMSAFSKHGLDMFRMKNKFPRIVG